MTPAPLVALVGNPNSGKSALFNALTGARQKVGNYPGVTVERHAGRMALDDGRPVELLDLPGAYSLEPSSPDERVTRDVITGDRKSVVYGKSVSGRIDLGGRRLPQKKTTEMTHLHRQAKPKESR